MKINVSKAFAWRDENNERHVFPVGECDMPARPAEIAIRNDWGKPVAGKSATAKEDAATKTEDKAAKSPAENKSRKAAPENK